MNTVYSVLTAFVTFVLLGSYQAYFFTPYTSAEASIVMLLCLIFF